MVSRHLVGGNNIFKPFALAIIQGNGHIPGHRQGIFKVNLKGKRIWVSTYLNGLGLRGFRNTIY